MPSPLVKSCQQVSSNPALTKCQAPCWGLGPSPWFSINASAAVVQALGHVWPFVTPWTAAHQAPCPSPSPRAHSNSCPLIRWCHPTISSSAVPFSSRLQSFPTPGPLPMSQLFASSTSAFHFDVNRGRGHRSHSTPLCAWNWRTWQKGIHVRVGSPKQGFPGTICFKVSKNQLEMCGKTV